MGIVDKQMGWMRKKEIYDPYRLGSILEDGTSGIFGSALSGTPQDVDWEEVSTFGFVAPTMTDAELLGGYINLPYDLDPKFDIGFSIKYVVDVSAAAAVSTWILLVGAKKEGIALAAGATALDVAIPAHTYVGPVGAASAADWIPQVTGRGILRPSTHLFSYADIVTMRAGITVSIEIDSITNETALRFIALIMDYVPQRTVGVGNESDRPLRYDERS